jgi:hypothetical protein
MKTLKCQCFTTNNNHGTTRNTKPILDRFCDRKIPRSLKAFFSVSAGCLFFGATASAQQVYTMEFNQGNNLFGVFNLLTGNFTQLGSEGGTLFNDIAATPNGALYGIVNSASLVTLDTTDGAITKSVTFSVSGIESLAVAPNGTVYGASQSALYTLDPTDGQASLVGNFDNSLLGNAGQNIRFAANGNLYDTDGGGSAINTDLFQISLANGAASTLGVLSNIPGMCLGNAGQVMYGVGIQLNSASTLVPGLIEPDLGSIQPGGTNANGTIANIGVTVVNNGFPNNYNFSGSTSYAVPGTPVPEPGVAGLFVAGGVALQFALRRRK